MANHNGFRMLEVACWPKNWKREIILQVILM